ncbi:phage major capsid protein [Cellvibrio sp. KY-GH-1]|uniref:phage major capsid protein n=1 Tax=Cellvibrio sp. KY-GH-1 TaxID=2303332 RepID=UPI0012467357|nr:phage major capsid protein [Cellvibrio sp. KY-GH-1]QEY15472.1 phage major capsid protein [Cellvibrio sp. KY-GH-1]
MKKLKLSPVFMLSVIFIAAIIPVVSGLEPMSFVASGAFVAATTFLIDKTPVALFRKHAQAGEVGEDLKRVEAEYKQVGAQLKQIGDDLKAQAEASQKELKKNAELSAETKTNVDKLLTEQGVLQARLTAAEQKLVQVEGNSNEPSRVLSLGQHVVQSEKFEGVDWNVTSKLSIGINAAITSLDTSAGSLVVPDRQPGIVGLPQRRLTIRDLIAPGRTGSNMIEYVKETGFTNNAAPVSENPTNDKPESDIDFELVQSGVKTIAHLVRASKQILDDAAQLSSYIDARLRYGLQLKEELQLLKGSGTGNNLNGIYTQAVAYANPGVTVQNQTWIDQLRLALLQAELAEYYADGIVLSPIDWASIELTKDTQNKYILANPFGLTMPTLWSRPVVATQSMDAGDFLVGAFKLGAQVYDREDANVVISTEDKDNFSKNMITIRAEERLALAVYRPEAFVKGEFEVASA